MTRKRVASGEPRAAERRRAGRPGRQEAVSRAGARELGRRSTRPPEQKTRPKKKRGPGLLTQASQNHRFGFAVSRILSTAPTSANASKSGEVIIPLRAVSQPSFSNLPESRIQAVSRQRTLPFRNSFRNALRLASLFDLAPRRVWLLSLRRLP